MATTSNTVPPALPPFDAPGRGTDLVIITSDSTVLYVVKAFLIYASPFFDNLLSDSSPDETYEDLPVYRSAEDCRTMCAVVRLCYPLAIELETMTEAVLDALQKYIMEDVQERLKQVIRSSEMMKTEPIRVYAIACRYRWADVARAAGKEVLRIPLHEWGTSGHVTGRDHDLLVQYFEECSRVAVAAFSDKASPEKPAMTFLSEDMNVFHYLWNRSNDCGCSKLGILVYGSDGVFRYPFHSWIADFILRARECLRDTPGVDIMSAGRKDIAVFASGEACGSLKGSSAGRVQQMIEIIDRGLKAAMSKVEIQLDF